MKYTSIIVFIFTTSVVTRTFWYSREAWLVISPTGAQRDCEGSILDAEKVRIVISLMYTKRWSHLYVYR